MNEQKQQVARAPTDVGQLRLVLLVWTFAVAAEMIVFCVGLGRDAGPAPSASPLQLVQVVVSALFPISLLLVATRLRTLRGIRGLAWFAATLSSVAWLA